MTLERLRIEMDISVRGQFDRYRDNHGDGLHALVCLGTIDGASASLARATGHANAAEALYRAADEMIARHVPAPAVRLRRRCIARRLWEPVARVSPYGWYFAALAMLAAYGLWRAM